MAMTAATKETVNNSPSWLRMDLKADHAVNITSPLNKRILERHFLFLLRLLQVSEALVHKQHLSTLVCLVFQLLYHSTALHTLVFQPSL